MLGCPHCKSRCTIPETLLGKIVRCPKCQKTFRADPPLASTNPTSANPVSSSPRVGIPNKNVPQRATPSADKNPAPISSKRMPQAPRSRDAVIDDTPEEINIRGLDKTLPRRARHLRIVLGIAAGIVSAVIGGLALWWTFGVGGNEQAGHGRNDPLAANKGKAEADEAEFMEPAPAPAPALPIKPAPLAQDQETRDLPGIASAVFVGGGGRFLFFHVPERRQLAVFDVNAANFLKHLPIADDKVQFAAGAEKLIVYLSGPDVFQRWDLAKMELEATVPNPMGAPVHTMKLGSASRGPLILLAKFEKKLVALDPISFKEIAFQQEVGGRLTDADAFAPPEIRVSADGQLVTLSNSGLPSGLRSIIIEGNVMRGYINRDSDGLSLPGPDGQTLLNHGQVYTAELKPIGEPAVGHFFLPAAVHGNAYLSFIEKMDAKDFRRTTLTVSVHMLGNRRPLCTLPSLPGMDEIRARLPTPLQNHERHVHFIPDAKLIAVLAFASDKLHLMRFDLDVALDKSGVDFLYVTSRPPARVIPGKGMKYQVQAKSRQGGLTYRLDAGPEGMKLGADGKLTWMVPANASGDHSVIVTVSDKSGQEIFHTFKMRAGS